MTLQYAGLWVDVIADTQEEAQDCLTKVLDVASIYGVGLSYVTEQDRAPGTDVTRIFDYDLKAGDAEDCVGGVQRVLLDVSVVLGEHDNPHGADDYVQDVLEKARCYGDG